MSRSGTASAAWRSAAATTSHFSRRPVSRWGAISRRSSRRCAPCRAGSSCSTANWSSRSTACSRSIRCSSASIRRPRAWRCSRSRMPAWLLGVRPAEQRRRGPRRPAVDRTPRAARGSSPRPSMVKRCGLSPATRSRSIVDDWFERVGGALDGVIAKRADLPYASGTRDAAVKVKRTRTADCVVGGFRYAKGSNSQVGSLLLGLYDDDGLLDYIGFCSAFSAAERSALLTRLRSAHRRAGLHRRRAGQLRPAVGAAIPNATAATSSSNTRWCSRSRSIRLPAAASGTVRGRCAGVPTKHRANVRTINCRRRRARSRCWNNPRGPRVPRKARPKGSATCRSVSTLRVFHAERPPLVRSRRLRWSRSPAACRPQRRRRPR